MLLCRFSLTFLQTQIELLLFIAQLSIVLKLIMSLRDYLINVPWEDIIDLGSSAATAAESCEWVQAGIDVNIPPCKYQVKSHSSP